MTRRQPTHYPPSRRFALYFDLSFLARVSSVYSGPGPGLVTHFFLSCTSRHEPPRKPPLDTHLTPSSSASRWGGSRRPPWTPPASALRARRRRGGRCAPGRLRRAFERVTCHGRPRVEQRLIWRAAARQVGGWRPSGKARECGGGGAWRWRRVKGREGAYGGRTRAQRSRRRRRASRMRVGGDNLRTLPG